MATYNIKSLDQLTQITMKAVISKIEKLLDTVAKKVKERVDEEIEKYYNEYDPAWDTERRYWYNRTEQLRNSCKISPIKKGANSLSVEIYIDIDGLNYSTPGADPWKTVIAADTGSLHGGWVIENGEAKYQVPFNQLNQYVDDNGVRIWSNPMNALLDNHGLRDIFIEEARKLGLNIVAK